MKAHRAQAILLCLGLLSACGGGSLAPGVGGILQSIQITPSGPSVPLGLNQQFTATGHYRDGSMKDITGAAAWASSNSGIATISGSGLASSRATGSSTISATLSGVSGSSTLTVTQAILVSIAITPASPVVVLGTVQQFTATGTFSDGSTQDITASVTWASSNETMASINTGGLAAAFTLGSVTISATSGTISGSTAVNIELATLSSITIRPENGKIAQLTSQQFQAIGTYTDGTTHNVTGKVAWTSSNTGVATIGGGGLASAVAPGSTTISAALDSISASTTLDVSNATLVSISIRPSGRTIMPGTRLTFAATGLFSDNSTQVITRDCTWASDNPAVATISVRGVATGVGPGTANISATLNGVTGSVPLSVSSATISSISVSPASAVLAPTTAVNCVATGTFSDGSTVVITNVVKWSSSASGVASVNGGGRVTAESGGSATITAEFGGINGNSSITVDASPLTSIQVSPPTASIPAKTSVAFHATGTFADGKTQDLTAFALWTSSMPSIATINAGHASGLEPGTTTIVAEFGGQDGTADLTVTSASAASLMVLPAATDLERGGFRQFTALAEFSDGTTEDVTPWVSWESSSVDVAAVTPSGRAITTGTGTTTVTATMDGLKGTAIVRVR